MTLLLRLFSFIIAVMLIASIQAFSQCEYVYRNYSTLNGLPSSEVYVALQDNEGYMWFATDKGVAKFNGFEFQNFTVKDGLPDNVIIKMNKDQFGRIWFIGFNGSLAYYQQGKIYSYSHNKTLQEYGKGQLIIKSLLFLDSSTVVIETTNHTPITIYEDGSYSVYETETADAVSLTIHPAKYQHQLLYSAGNRTSNKLQIHLPNGVNHQVALKNVNRNHSKYVLYEDLVVLCIGDDLMLVQDSLTQYVDLGHHIINMYVDGPYLWVMTIHDGIKKMHWDGTQLQVVEHLLKGHTVSSFYRDKNNSIWITTTDDGIFYILDERIKMFEKQTARISDFTAKGDLLYIGNTNGNLDVFDMSTEERVFNYKAAGHIQDIYVREDNSFLVSAEEIMLFDADYQLVKTCDFSYSFYNLSKGIDGGILLNIRTRLAYTNNLEDEEVLLKGLVGHSFYDGQNRLVYANDKGVFRQEENGHLAELLKCKRIKFMASISDKIVVYNDVQMMYIIDDENIDSMSIAPVIGDLIISDFHLQNDSTVWLSSNEGLLSLNFKNKPKLNSLRIDAQYGLADNELKDIRINGDDLLIRTHDAVMHMKDYKRQQTYEAKLAIAQLSVNGLRKDLDEKLHFKHQENEVVVDLNLLSLNSLGRRNLQYILNDKVYKTTDKYINFFNLEPGDYTLTIQMMNQSWRDCLAMTSISFSIAPPFWNTLWFYGLIALVFSCLTAAILLYRQRRRQLKIKQNELLVSYQQKALLAQMKPHFIYNSLNSIQSHVLKNDKFEAHKYISQFGELVRKNLEWSEKDLVSIRNEIKLIHLYVELEKRRLNKALDFKLEIDREVDQDKSKIPPFILQPIIENAIWHGINHPEIKEGKIEVIITKKEDFLQFVIQDNGVGIQYTTQLKKTHNSMATKISLKRILLLEQKYNYAAQYRIVDLKNENLKGTRVRFLLPITYE